MDHDNVNHPPHYNAYKGFEVILLTEQMNFNKGNAVEYISRAGLKNPSTEIEDLQKARWYIDREIQRLEKLNGEDVAEALYQAGIVPKAEIAKDEAVPNPMDKISSIVSVVQNTIDTATRINKGMAQISIILSEFGIPVTAAREIGAMIIAAEHRFRVNKNEVPKKD